MKNEKRTGITSVRVIPSELSKKEQAVIENGNNFKSVSDFCYNAILHTAVANDITVDDAIQLQILKYKSLAAESLLQKKLGFSFQDITINFRNKLNSISNDEEKVKSIQSKIDTHLEFSKYLIDKVAQDFKVITSRQDVDSNSFSLDLGFNINNENAN